jgi:transcriptional regulator with XRE-family HTH domain
VQQDDDIDLAGLAVLVKGHRHRRDLTLKQASAECGVSGSTISRVERQEARPDLATIRQLVDWLEIPIDRVVRQGVKKRTKSKRDSAEVMGNIEVQLRADPKLPPKAADALIQIMRAAYTQFVEDSDSASEDKED